MKTIDLSSIERNFRLNIPAFRKVPETVAEASIITKKYGEGVAPLPPEKISVLVEKAKLAFKGSGGENLTPKEFRSLAYEILGLNEGNAFLKNLLKGIDAIGTRRLFSALFSSYIMYFDSANPSCDLVANLLQKNKENLSKSWKQKLEFIDLLNAKTIESALAKRILKARNDEEIFDRIDPTGVYAESQLFQAVTMSIANQTHNDIMNNNLAAFDGFFNIVNENGKVKSKYRVASMIGLLKPFIEKSPSSEQKNKLQELLINTFSDPRIRSANWPKIEERYGGKELRDKCILMVKRWLILETIELFFKIISDSADIRQFEPRRDLWKSYFDQEHVVDAHVIFGSDAARMAKYLKETDDTAKDLQWGKVSGSGVNPRQSFLLMQIGDLTIVEGSHNRKLRAWSYDSPQKPIFHEQAYHIRSLTSGSNENMGKYGSYGDGIVHLGDWIQRAKDYIDGETGIKLSKPPRKIR